MFLDIKEALNNTNFESLVIAGAWHGNATWIPHSIYNMLEDHGIYKRSFVLGQDAGDYRRNSIAPTVVFHSGFPTGRRQANANFLFFHDFSLYI